MCFYPNELLKEKVGKITHSTPWPAPSGLAEGAGFWLFHMGSAAHNNISLFPLTPRTFPCPLERSVWEKSKNLTNQVRNQQRAMEEKKPPNHLEWLPWITNSQAGLNLLKFLFLRAKRHRHLSKIKMVSNESPCRYRDLICFVSAISSCLAPSRDCLGRAVGGSRSFCCDPVPATAASSKWHLLIHGHFYLYSSFIKAMGHAIGW